jgi:hypothetical protein
MSCDLEKDPKADSRATGISEDQNDTLPKVNSGQAARTQATNDSIVPTTPVELEPHVRVIRPSRPSLTYERVE